MFASHTFIYNLKHGMYHVHIPKDMYLHDILVGKKNEIKIFDQNGFYDWVLVNLLLKQQHYDFWDRTDGIWEILWIVKTSGTFGAGWANI